MRISKGTPATRLKSPVTQLHDVAVRTGKVWVRIEQVPMHYLMSLERKVPKPAARPKFVALDISERDCPKLRFYPPPDKRYECEVIASQLVKL